jgi:hypothetical protein
VRKIASSNPRKIISNIPVGAQDHSLLLQGYNVGEAGKKPRSAMTVVARGKKLKDPIPKKIVAGERARYLWG